MLLEEKNPFFMPRTKQQTSQRSAPSDEEVSSSAQIVANVKVNYTPTPPTPSLSKMRCLYVCNWISRACYFQLFAKPVDWQGLKLFDYPQIIQHPMDFQTLISEVEECEEFDFVRFMDRSRLIWANACLYNPTGHPVNNAANELANCFENKMTSLQKHPEDDVPDRVSNQLLSLVYAFFQESFACDFVMPINVDNDVHYAECIIIPYCLTYITNDLEQGKYVNRYDVQHDVNLIVENAINFNGSNSLIGVAAKRLKEVADRLFAFRLPEIDDPYFISSPMRHQLADNIVSINDEQRLIVMSKVQQICSDAIMVECMNESSMSVDMLSRKQFIVVDAMVRQMMIKNQETVSK